MATELEYSDILRYKTNSSAKYRPGLSDNQKRNIRDKAARYIVEKDQLYVEVMDKNLDLARKRRVIVKEEAKKRILRMCHEGIDGMHFGRDKTYGKIIDEFYWKGIHADVQDFCKRCEKCQRTNRVLQKPRSELHPIPVTKVWHKVGIDLVGPLPETKKGNKYIITLSDYFSKWPEAAPIPSKEATCVARFLLDTFCRHGWPKYVLSDQGREFVNTINSCLFEMTGVKHCVSSAYHPQTNGLDERLNQTLVTTLKKVVDACSGDWDEHISAALYAYRISPQASSKFSPFFLMYNRQPRKAVSLAIDEQGGDADKENEEKDELSGNEDAEDIDAVVEKLLTIRERCHLKAKTNIDAAQQKQKSQYDKKHSALKVYPVGSKVWLRNMANSHRMGGKLDPVYTGPYTVAEILDKGRYCLQRANGTRLKKLYNGILLKEVLVPVEQSESDLDEQPMTKKSKTSTRTSKKRKINPDPAEHSDSESNEQIDPKKPSRRQLPTTKKDIQPMTKKSKTSKPPSKKRKINPSERSWVPSLSLTFADKECIESSRGLLTDKHMMAAGKILAKQFPGVQGLQSPLLCQTEEFSPISTESNAGYVSEALQFFYESERKHWVATAYLEGEVQLYDSKFTGKLARSLEQQICQVYQSAVVDGNLLVTVVAVQQQKGSTECGVMAIANGYHDLRGDDLSTISFAEEQMRNHLNQCFENKSFTPFPVALNSRAAETTFDIKYVNVEVSCECHRPDSIEDMICCDGCDRWCHMQCAGLASVPEGDWFCFKCY